MAVAIYSSKLYLTAGSILVVRRVENIKLLFMLLLLLPLLRLRLRLRLLLLPLLLRLRLLQ